MASWRLSPSCCWSNTMSSLHLQAMPLGSNGCRIMKGFDRAPVIAWGKGHWPSKAEGDMCAGGFGQISQAVERKQQCGLTGAWGNAALTGAQSSFARLLWHGLTGLLCSTQKHRFRFGYHHSVEYSPEPRIPWRQGSGRAIS